MTKMLGAVLGLALAVSASSAMAVGISNLNAQSCGDFAGTWHFVHNQTGGATAGTLDANWSSGDTCHVDATKVLASTQHYYCIASGALTGASDSINVGKLVLSDYTCEAKCDPKDPKCVEPPK